MRFASFVVVLGYLLLTVTSLPQPAKSPSNWKKPCDNISKYSVDWFVQNAPRVRKPKPSTCLFYTYMLSEQARKYAKQRAGQPLTTIWDVWPGGYYNKDLTSQNPLRCIMRNILTDQATYFSHMSLAFASLCNGEATVMDRSITATNKTFNTVNKTGIWFKFEFPMLQKGFLRNKKNKVDSIKAISPDGLHSFLYWKRGGFGISFGGQPELRKKRSIQEIISTSVDFITNTAGKITDDHDSFIENNGLDSQVGWWEDDVVFNDIDYEDWDLE